ncbi:MAG: peptidylprolyl isomerase [Dysgonamonadaceae bacterium]|jgi:peptidyl-prolyl cis-trans isomerase SurA|nr:peptidylprolyl isomerase [Dysgonamonadaceae bacterium]
MKKHFYLILFLLVSPFATNAQIQGDDPVVMTVNGKDVRKSEFLYSYGKNNTEETVEKKTIDEYAELFKNFKLWIAEGEAQKIDTTQAFRTELADYREQLAKPYQEELSIDESLVRQEYERMGQIIKISHILLAFPGYPNNIKPLPSDTVDLYKKAQDIQKQLKKGEKFTNLVDKYSDDSRSKAQGGTIGWFSGMNLNYQFEQGAFSVPEGKAGIIRTNWGYHILRVDEKQPYQGEYHVAHILVRVDKHADTVKVADAEKKVLEAYDKVAGGANFGEIAKEYSDDNKTPEGDLGWIDLHRTVPEFWNTVKKMKEDEISRPFRTDFGFHVVKLLETKEPASYEEKKPIIEDMFSNYGYFIPLHRHAIEQLKRKYDLRKNETSYRNLQELAKTIYPSETEYYDAVSNDDNELFSLKSKSFTIADFAEYLKANSQSPYKLSTEFLTDRLENYEYYIISKEKAATLENEYPEFRNLMQEYRDGIILFEVKNREIWDKASTDSAGLADFLAANREKYAWDSPRFKGYVVLTKDAKTTKQIRKQTTKMQPEEAVRYALENFKVGEVEYVKVEKGLFAKGENAFVDQKIFKSGKAEFPENFGDFFLIGKTLNLPESPEDVKSQIITDYQDYLEKIWIKRLNENYSVKIYQEVLKSIYN